MADTANLPDVGPGDRWSCPTCGFVLLRALLRACDGAVGPDTRLVQDVCPNDGSSLRPVTWQEDAADANRVGLEQMKRADALNEALVESLAALNLGHRKLLTYGSVYPGDKELHKTLIPMWEAAIKKAEDVVNR